MSDLVRWCAIADPKRRSDEKRYLALSEAMKLSGLDNEMTFLTSTAENIQNVLDSARNDFAQIRFVGQVGTWVLPILERIPSAVKSLKSADALVCETHEWWPRFFLVEGLNQMLANDHAMLDLRGSVFIFGATSEARAVIAALSKIGFNKMIISDPDEAVCTAFVEDLRKSYFGTQFQSVPRQFVTQLPGICSVAVNTVSESDAGNSSSDLAYFNFLKAGGSWLDLSIFPLNASLKTEALSVGATVIEGAQGFAFADQLWASSVFNISIDTTTYSRQLLF